MTDTYDLPLFAQPYPNSPGYARGSATSREAARAIEPQMRPLHRQILSMLATADLTADELAERIGRHLLVLRPRASELRELGFIEVTGHTRPSALGNSQAVLRLTADGRAALSSTVTAEQPNS